MAAFVMYSAEMPTLLTKSPSRSNPLRYLRRTIMYVAIYIPVYIYVYIYIYIYICMYKYPLRHLRRTII